MSNEKEANDAMLEIYRFLSGHQEPLPPEFQKVLNDNLWELLVKDENKDTNSR